MTSRRVVGSVTVLAVAVLGLSACSSDKPSGLAPFTPSVSSASASPSASPTSTSKWTPEQQQVIDGYDRFNNLISVVWTKTEKIDMAKARKVAKEPFVTTYLKGVEAGLSAGFVRTGKVVNTISAVTIVGDTATIETCLDATHTKLINPGNPSAPPYEVRPPSKGTVALARAGDSWLVAGLKGGGGACVSG